MSARASSTARSSLASRRPADRPRRGGSTTVVHAPVGLSTTNVEDEKAVWDEALAAMPDLRHDVREVVVDGDVEMARVVVTGTMAANFAGVEGSRRSFRIDQAVITHLRDEKVIEA
ncbi:MAG: ester cyclase [Solirubrobacterales bacterium]